MKIVKLEISANMFYKIFKLNDLQVKFFILKKNKTKNLNCNYCIIKLDKSDYSYYYYFLFDFFSWVETWIRQ